jgi:organic radical activating enzyme
MKEIKVIENFQSFQGEGPDAGRRQLILRFKVCNRIRDGHGCKFCDTALKMRISNEMTVSLEEIQNIVIKNKTGLLISGGEPTSEENFESTVSLINEIDAPLYNVETNGYELVKLINVCNLDKNVKYILSPKIFSENDYNFYVNLVTRIRHNPRVFIKLVYEDRPEIDKFLDYLMNVEFDNQRIYLMPEGTTKEKIMEHSSMVFDVAEKYKVNFSSREHIIYSFV